MTKQDAFDVLAPGVTGTDAINEVASICGVCYQAVVKWPSGELPPGIENRVLAAIYRMRHPREVYALSKCPLVANPFAVRA